MSSAGDFAHALSTETGLKEVDLVLRAAWFLRETTGQKDIPVADAVDFLKQWSIRPNINTTRLKGKLRKSKDVSYQAGGLLHIPAAKMHDFKTTYGSLLETKAPDIDDRVLQAEDFSDARPYVVALVRQINGAHQFELYDCCAVMMRRLAEVLIVDAYSRKGADSLIRSSDGNLKMMNGLINALNSGATFRLSRRAPEYLEHLKTLGDTAAHSRNYITKRKDIEDFAQKYRMLVEELKDLH